MWRTFCRKSTGVIIFYSGSILRSVPVSLVSECAQSQSPWTRLTWMECSHLGFYKYPRLCFFYVNGSPGPQWPLTCLFWTFPYLQHTWLKPSAHHRASSHLMNLSFIFALYLARLAFYRIRWFNFACCFGGGQVANGRKNTCETFTRWRWLPAVLRPSTSYIFFYPTASGIHGLSQLWEKNWPSSSATVYKPRWLKAQSVNKHTSNLLGRIAFLSPGKHPVEHSSNSRLPCNS